MKWQVDEWKVNSLIDEKSIVMIVWREYLFICEQRAELSSVNRRLVLVVVWGTDSQLSPPNLSSSSVHYFNEILLLWFSAACFVGGNAS